MGKVRPIWGISDIQWGFFASEAKLLGISQGEFFHQLIDGHKNNWKGYDPTKQEDEKMVTMGTRIMDAIDRYICEVKCCKRDNFIDEIRMNVGGVSEKRVEDLLDLMVRKGRLKCWNGFVIHNEYATDSGVRAYRAANKGKNPPWMAENEKIESDTQEAEDEYVKNMSVESIKIEKEE